MERLQKIEVVNGGEMRVQFVILLMRMFFVLCTEKLSVLLVIHSNLTHNQIPKSRTTIVLVVAKLLVTIKTLPKPQASSPRESGSFFFWQDASEL